MTARATMDAKNVLRLIAMALLVGGVIACAVDTGGLGQGTEPSRLWMQERGDPLTAELRRCNASGAEGVNDAACKAAWARNRERFLAPASNGSDEPSRAMSRPSAKLPSEIFPDQVQASPRPDAHQIRSQGR